MVSPEDHRERMVAQRPCPSDREQAHRRERKPRDRSQGLPDAARISRFPLYSCNHSKKTCTRPPVAGPSPAQRAAGTGLSQVRRSACSHGTDPGHLAAGSDSSPYPADFTCRSTVCSPPLHTLTVALDHPDCSCYAARHHPE